VRYNPLSSHLFARNRKKLAERLRPGALVVIHSNGMLYHNDGAFPFVQQADFYYLTGIDQEGCTLLLFPECPDPDFREVLFIEKQEENNVVWEGRKLNKQEAGVLSGIEKVTWQNEFRPVLQKLLLKAECIYLLGNEGMPDNAESVNGNYAKTFASQNPLYPLERLKPMVASLRTIKENEEIEAIQKAIYITEMGFRNMASQVKSEEPEYALEAELTRTFISQGSRRHAFQPILASGKNACILHYIDNSERLISGEMLLVDAGAEYAGYHADITRVFPVNQRFTSRQRKIYQAVLDVHNQALEYLPKAGSLRQFNKTVAGIMEEKLVEVGLLQRTDINKKEKNPAYRKYYMHSAAHYLGLDVHDVGDTDQPLQPGMVITLEPGIYIKEEGLGIRLENDILITAMGYKNLSANIPLAMEEVEALKS